MDMHAASHVVGILFGFAIGWVLGWGQGDASGFQRAMRARLRRMDAKIAQIRAARP